MISPHMIMLKLQVCLSLIIVPIFLGGGGGGIILISGR